MSRTVTPRALTLAEAEQRLQRAIAKLLAAVRVRSSDFALVERLMLDNTNLENRLKSSKVDYHNLEITLAELKKKFSDLKSTSGKKLQEEFDGVTDDKKNISAEVDFLKKELERVHKEYKTLDSSFRLLRQQHSELQESKLTELDLLSEIDSNRKNITADLNETKQEIVSHLDKTISTLEKLVG